MCTAHITCSYGNDPPYSSLYRTPTLELFVSELPMLTRICPTFMPCRPFLYVLPGCRTGRLPIANVSGYGLPVNPDSVVSPNMEVLIVVPCGPHDVEVGEAGAEVVLFPTVSDVLGNSAFAMVFENLQPELAHGSFLFTRDNVVMALPIQVGNVEVVERILNDDYVSVSC